MSDQPSGTWWVKRFPDWDGIIDILGEKWGEVVRRRCDEAWRLYEAGDLPKPLSLSGLSDESVYCRFVVGTEPFPDLEAAEYFRRLLQQTMGYWVHDTMSAGMKLMAKAEERDLVSNRKRAILIMFSEGDFSSPAALARRVDEVVEADHARAKKYGFDIGGKDVSRKRIEDLKQMVKNIRKAGWPRLGVDEFEEITRDFAADLAASKADEA